MPGTPVCIHVIPFSRSGNTPATAQFQGTRIIDGQPVQVFHNGCNCPRWCYCCAIMFIPLLAVKLPEPASGGFRTVHTGDRLMVRTEVTGNPASCWFAGNIGSSSVHNCFINRGNTSRYQMVDGEGWNSGTWTGGGGSHENCVGNCREF